MRFGPIARPGSAGAGGEPERLGGGAGRLAESAAQRATDAAATGLDWLVAAAERLADLGLRGLRRGLSAWQRRPGGLEAAVSGRASDPVPILYEVHPEARQALARPLGLRSVPIDEICGSAVAGLAQRGGDFLPLPQFRSRNWQARWQRIRAAVDRLAVLPPIDVIKYGDCYWVNDGHNRVAAALYAGQVEIDADVTELRPPGTTGEPAGSLASSLADGWTARAAGEGRWTPTATAIPTAHDVDALDGPHEHTEHEA